MFEFKVVLNENDYLLFNQYHMLNSRHGKNLVLIYRLLVPVVSLLTVVTLYILDQDLQAALFTAFFMTILSVLGVVFAKKAIIMIMKTGITKLKKDGMLPYSKLATLKFSDDLIHEISPDSEHKIKYSLIEKVAVTESAIYIYFGAVQAYVLPMSTFSTEEEKRDFLAFINLKADISRSNKLA